MQNMSCKIFDRVKKKKKKGGGRKETRGQNSFKRYSSSANLFLVENRITAGSGLTRVMNHDVRETR